MMLITHDDERTPTITRTKATTPPEQEDNNQPRTGTTIATKHGVEDDNEGRC